MNELARSSEDAVATPAIHLASKWNLGRCVEGMVTTESFSACRWKHSLPELASVAVPVNILFYRFSSTRATRVQENRIEKSVYAQHGIGLIGQHEDGRWTYQDKVDILDIYISDLALRRAAAAEGNSARVSLQSNLTLNDPMLALLAREVGELHSKSLSESLYGNTLALAITMRLLRAHSGVSSPSRESNELRSVSPLAPWQLTRSIERLANGLDREISLQLLAAEVKLSPFHFARAFKASTGRPPHRYQIELRIERAKALLCCGNLPVTEIGASVGYEDPGYFSRLFRRRVGATPTEYRRDNMKCSGASRVISGL